MVFWLMPWLTAAKIFDHEGRRSARFNVKVARKFIFECQLVLTLPLHLLIELPQVNVARN